MADSRHRVRLAMVGLGVPCAAVQETVEPVRGELVAHSLQLALRQAIDNDGQHQAGTSNP